jgi:hypothetical protein
LAGGLKPKTAWVIMGADDCRESSAHLFNSAA